MKKILLALALVLLPNLANAQTTVSPCVQLPGTGVPSCAPVTADNPLPITVVGSITTSTTLGTSVSTTNPEISGDATTGFYTAGAGKIDAAVSGAQVMEFTSSGLALNTPLAIASGGTGGTTAASSLAKLLAFPLSAVTYPPGYFNGTTTNASGTDPQYSFAIRASSALGPSAYKNGTETSACSGANTAFGAFALGTLTGNQCYYESGSYALLGNGVQNVAVGNGAMSGATIAGCTADTGAGSFNTAVGGYITMNSLTCGQKNTAIGEANMSGLTTGSNNVAIGSEVMNVTASAGAIYNVAVGSDSAQRLTGGQNVVVGGNAAQNIAGSSYNVYEGFSTGSGMVGAGSTDYNVAVGAYAMSGSGTPSNNTGVNNVSIGTGSLIAITSGSGNAVLGHQAGNKVTTGGANTILGTNIATTTLTTGARNILIGVDASTDTPASGTNNWLNIGNAIFGTNLKNSTNTTGVTQLAIGTALTSIPNAAVLDLSSNTTSANSSLILPVGTTTARPSGVNGMIRYNSTTGSIEGYINSLWATISTDWFPGYVSTYSYLAAPDGIAFTSTNTTTEPSNTVECAIAYAKTPIPNVLSATFRTSSTNASAGASFKGCIYQADGTNHAPSTLLAHDDTGISVTDAATGTNFTTTFTAASNIPKGAYYLCTLHTFVTTAARFAITASASSYANVNGGTSGANVMNSAPVLGYSVAQTYASNCPSPFGSGSAITTPGALPIGSINLQ